MYGSQSLGPSPFLWILFQPESFGGLCIYILLYYYIYNYTTIYKSTPYGQTWLSRQTIPVSRCPGVLRLPASSGRSRDLRRSSPRPRCVGNCEHRASSFGSQRLLEVGMCLLCFCYVFAMCLLCFCYVFAVFSNFERNWGWNLESWSHFYQEYPRNSSWNSVEII